MNNFNSIRLLLAGFVVVAHSIILVNDTNNLYLLKFFNSYLAVKGFFVISGYLVFKSYLNSNSTSEYFVKRIKRIIPGYLGVIIFTLIIVFFVNKNTIESNLNIFEISKYALFNLLFLGTFKPSINGIFDSNYISALNGSLWTIKVELCLYALVPVLVYLFKRYNKFIVTIFFYFLSVSWVIFFKTYVTTYSEQLINQFVGQLCYFIIGCYLAQNLAKIKPHLIAGLILVCCNCLFNIYLFEIIFFPYVFSVILIFLCTNFTCNLNPNRYGDISYGVYLYHFPIIQYFISIDFLNKESQLFEYLSIYAIIILISYCSWHLIEKKFLRT